MAGVRVITYTESDAKMVFELIKNTFYIYPNTSSDKAEKLGVDRVGYHSLDCIASLGNVRLKLPEYRLFENMLFEIQIRTILQHAWAEFEHDRNYKFSVELPIDLKRRLFLIAANLESADREFDSLSKAIDTYRIEVEKGINGGALDIPISSLSLSPYLIEKLKELISSGVVAPEMGWGKDRIFKDLEAMGITTLKELDEAIPEDFAKKAQPYYRRILEGTEEMYVLYAVLIDIFIIHNPERYFNEVWQDSWQGIDRETIRLYESYGIKFSKYISRYNLDIL